MISNFHTYKQKYIKLVLISLAMLCTCDITAQVILDFQQSACECNDSNAYDLNGTKDISELSGCWITWDGRDFGTQDAIVERSVLRTFY